MVLKEECWEVSWIVELNKKRQDDVTYLSRDRSIALADAYRKAMRSCLSEEG